MAGSVVVTSTDRGRGVVEYSCAWTSDASGDVSSNTFAVKAGTIVGVRTKPSSGGTAPTIHYDMTLVDIDTVDLLTGLGANLSATVTVRAVPYLSTYGPIYFEGGNLDLVIANAGNAKQGTVTIWIREGG